MTKRFRGPMWPMVGPDWAEPLSRFRADHLRAHCRSVRVAEYLEQLEAESPARLLAELEAVRRELAEIKRRKPKGADRERPRTFEGIPL